MILAVRVLQSTFSFLESIFGMAVRALRFAVYAKRDIKSRKKSCELHHSQLCSVFFYSRREELQVEAFFLLQKAVADKLYEAVRFLNEKQRPEGQDADQKLRFVGCIIV